MTKALADTVVDATAALNDNAQRYFDLEEAVARREAAAVRAAGGAPSETDETELARALGRGLFVGAFGGDVNALSAIVPGGDSYPVLEPWVRLRGRADQTNSAAGATFTVQGVGTRAGTISGPLLRRDGSPLKKGDVPVGRVFAVQLDETNGFRIDEPVASDLIQSVIDSTIIPHIVDAPVLWIRTDGRDDNDGSDNTPGHALATLAGALRASTAIATTGAPIRLRFGVPGAYAEPGIVSRPGGSYTVEGDVGNPGSYIIQGGGGQDRPLVAAAGCSIALKGLTIGNSGSVADTVAATFGGTVSAEAVRFAASGNSPGFHIAAYPGGSVVLYDGCSFQGSMGGWAKSSGSLAIAGGTLTMLGTPRWSIAGIVASGGSIGLNGAVSIVGAAAGQRYLSTLVGAISTNGAGEEFFPGDVAGVKVNGGVYV